MKHVDNSKENMHVDIGAQRVKLSSNCTVNYLFVCLLDSLCYQTQGATINRLSMLAKECEAKNHCFNYKTNQCYDVVR